MYVKLMRRVGITPAFNRRAIIVHAAELIGMRQLPVTRLRAMCAAAQLPKAGSKDDLLARLVNKRFFNKKA